MKIGIISDTHMMTKHIDEAINYIKECDLILHAGDNFADSKYIHNKTGIDMIAVKGNCDFNDVEDEMLFELEGKQIFLCHGDKYGVKYDLRELNQRAKNIGANIVIFGHTHTPICKYIDDILFINPGSTSIPRGVEYRSLCILELGYNKIEVNEVVI